MPPEPLTEVIGENRWLASRYGTLAFFGDVRNGGRIDIADEADWLVDELADDARALNCEQDLKHILKIIRNGSGADRQIDLFRLRRLEGDSKMEAMLAVVDLVVAETKEGIYEPASSSI